MELVGTAEETVSSANFLPCSTLLPPNCASHSSFLIFDVVLICGDDWERMLWVEKQPVKWEVGKWKRLWVFSRHRTKTLKRHRQLADLDFIYESHRLFVPSLVRSFILPLRARQAKNEFDDDWFGWRRNGYFVLITSFHVPVAISLFFKPNSFGVKCEVINLIEIMIFYASSSFALPPIFLSNDCGGCNFPSDAKVVKRFKWIV